MILDCLNPQKNLIALSDRAVVTLKVIIHSGQIEIFSDLEKEISNYRILNRKLEAGLSQNSELGLLLKIWTKLAIFPKILKN